MSKIKYIVPNLCTSFSLILGLASVFHSMHGDYETAAWMILWGVLLDKLDGVSARLLNASSELGAQLDSFADFVSFGIAPAALFTCALAEPTMDVVNTGWVMAGSAVYVVAVAVRLSRFNISTPPMSDRVFYGIPTTLMGAMLAGWYLSFSHQQFSPVLMSPMPFVLLIASFAMISSIKLPKLKLTSKPWLNVLAFSNVTFSYIAAPLKKFPEILFIQAVSYALIGVIAYAINPPEDAEEVEAEEEPVEAMV